MERPTHLVAEYFSPLVTGQLPCMDVKSVSLRVQLTRALSLRRSISWLRCRQTNPSHGSACSIEQRAMPAKTCTKCRLCLMWTSHNAAIASFSHIDRNGAHPLGLRL